jgi:hypothetical protein
MCPANLFHRAEQSHVLAARGRLCTLSIAGGHCLLVL